MKAEQDLLNQESWRRYKESVYRKATAACYASSANATTSSRCINRWISRCCRITGRIVFLLTSGMSLMSHGLNNV